VAEFKMVDCGAGASVRVENCGYNIILFTAGLNSILRIIMMRQVLTVPAVSNVLQV